MAGNHMYPAPAPLHFVKNGREQTYRFFPNVELPYGGFNATPHHVKNRYMNVHFDYVSIGLAWIKHYLQWPEDLLSSLAEAVDLMQQMHKGTYQQPHWVKKTEPFRYWVQGGLIYKSEQSWNKVDNSAHYLTVGRSDLRNMNETDSLSHYIRMDVHEQILRDAPTDIEKIVLNSVKQGHSDLRNIIAQEVHTGVAKGIEAAIAKGTATLQQIGSERERLEKHRTELDKKIERLRLAEEKEQQRQAQKEANRRTKTKVGYVYLVKSPTGAYKIGRTSNPNDRMKTFTVKLPFEVEFIHLIHTSDMYTLEMELHTHYEQCRIDGEWFALTDADVQEFCSIVGDVKE